MKVHISYNNEREYKRLAPIIDMLKADKGLKLKEKFDLKHIRKHLYFVQKKGDKAI